MNVYQILNQAEFIFFTTQIFSLKFNMSISAASQRLSRMAKKNVITRIKRNLWCNTQHPYFSVLGVVPYLLGKEQGYVSFLTALNMHGMISQIPQIYQIATTGHTKTIQTAIGVFEFHQIKPDLMRSGIDWHSSKCPYRMACAEKALLDTLYISTRKKKKFCALPELSMDDFSKEKFRALLKDIRPEILQKTIFQKFKTAH